MAPNLDVTSAELDILQLLWERGPLTVRQIADVLYPGGRPAQYATVQTLLTRLQDKQCVASDKAQRPHQYRAAVDREGLIGWRLRQTAEKLCGGSLTPLLLHLLEAGDYDEAERAELRDHLEQLRKRPQDRTP
ncbi:MAG: BlaI/MecI/CopY family transcriptional regulator [Gemmataceae bacterium]